MQRKMYWIRFESGLSHCRCGLCSKEAVCWAHAGSGKRSAQLRTQRPMQPKRSLMGGRMPSIIYRIGPSVELAVQAEAIVVHRIMFRKEAS